MLPDVWIRPPFGGRGRKMTGQLEAHANGFRYTSPKGETLDIMYRCALSPALPPLVCHLQLLTLPGPAQPHGDQVGPKPAVATGRVQGVGRGFVVKRQFVVCSKG